MCKDILQVLKGRRSVRSYKSDMVSDAELDKIVEAGLYAASGMGRQPVKIIVIKDKDMREKIRKANADVIGRDGDPFYGAPVVILVIADKSSPTHVYDGALALGNMMNEAHSIGLGSVWIHRAKEEMEGEFGAELKTMLSLDGDYEGIGHLALGYPEGELPPAKERTPGRAYRI